MATPALRSRVSPAAESVDVLYTDAPEPAAVDLLLKTVPVSEVAVATDPVYVAGGARLVEVTLADAEIAPERRFVVRAHVAGQAVSAASAADDVPAQLTDSTGALLFDSDGSPLIPAP